MLEALEQATAKVGKLEEEHKFLLWFYQNADFGPADGDVRESLKSRYCRENYCHLPERFKYEEE